MVKNIGKNDLEFYKTSTNVISTRFNGGKLLIHVNASQQPLEGFRQVSPDLEDVYFTSLFSNQMKTTSYVESTPAI